MMVDNIWLILIVLVTSMFTSQVSSKAFEDLNLSEETLHRVKRIVNGEVVEEGQWPWLVHLRASVKVKTSGHKWWCLWLCGHDYERRTVNCGGAIIHNRWILAAAHCFEDSNPRITEELRKSKAFHITSGEVDWKCTWDDYIEHLWARIFGNVANRCHIHGTEVIIHPQYQGGASHYWDYDFALLKTEADILRNDHTGRIVPCDENVCSTCSGPAPEWPTEGDTGYVHGWGCTSIGGSTSSTARGAEIPVRSSSFCQSIFGSNYDPTTHICAGGTGTSVCNGDSGGPLVVRNRANQYCQAGVVSFFVSGRSTQPSGFSKVSAVRDWIRQHTGV